VTTNGRVTEIISKRVNLSPKTYERATKIIEFGTQDVKEKLRNGISTISKEYKKIIKEQKRNQMMQVKPLIKFPQNVKLTCRDFRVKSKLIPDKSIDLVFTDPPFSKDNLQLYNDLIKESARVLKDGGSLVFYVGNTLLPQVINLTSSELKYWWMLCIELNEGHRLMYDKFVFSEYKILLWFVKGKKPSILEPFGDRIRSNMNYKALHPWEQSTGEASYMIRKLTVPHATIYDPMMGSGTTIIAALATGRKAIGIEVDKNTYDLAKKRVSQFLKKNGPTVLKYRSI